jgi:hypothetical protein
MIASSLAILTALTSVGSVVYYKKSVSRNDQAVRVAQLIEAQMEKVRNRTWHELVNAETGIFPPGGVDGDANPISVWPAYTGPFTRYKCDALSVTLIKDSVTSVEDYSGLTGQVDVFFTPITLRTTATDSAGTLVSFDVNVYKVDTVIVLDESSRVRAGTGTDTWGATTYISEFNGRDDAEFSQRVLETLRQRRVDVSGGGGGAEDDDDLPPVGD